MSDIQIQLAERAAKMYAAQAEVAQARPRPTIAKVSPGVGVLAAAEATAYSKGAVDVTPEMMEASRSHQ